LGRLELPIGQPRRAIRANIELSRKHILNDLETATHPNHKRTLEAALAHLDEKLNELS